VPDAVVVAERTACRSSRCRYRGRIGGEVGAAEWAIVEVVDAIAVAEWTAGRGSQRGLRGPAGGRRAVGAVAVAVEAVVEVFEEVAGRGGGGRRSRCGQEV